MKIGAEQEDPHGTNPWRNRPGTSGSSGSSGATFPFGRHIAGDIVRRGHFFTLSFALDLTPTLTSSPHLPILLPTYHQTRFFDPPTTPTRVPAIFYFSTTVLGVYTRTVPITTYLSINKYWRPPVGGLCAILPTGCLKQQTIRVYPRFSPYQYARIDPPGPITAISVLCTTATTIQFSVSDRKPSGLKIGAGQEDPHDTNP